MPPYQRAQRRPRPPLTPASLQELALHYVGRFATSRAKLAAYLTRKLRERGWEGPTPADPASIAERLAKLGYVDDAAFASAKARSLLSRGYGGRRIGAALHAAGIGEEDGAPARAAADDGAIYAAILFAERRRFGPFAREAPDPRTREKMIAAMLRAGHGFDLSRRLVSMAPGSAPDRLVDFLSE